MRSYDVYVPASSAGPAAVPLVVDLHGLGGNKTVACSQEAGELNHE